MTLNGESLKRFLPFYKSNSLVASSSPYNWLKNEKFFAINICYFADSINWKIVMRRQLFGGHMSIWNNRPNVCESRLNDCKAIEGAFFYENSTVAPLEWNLEFLMFQFCSACRAESIGILFVKIGWTVENLLLGVFFSWKFPGGSPRMILWVFDFSVLFLLLRWIEWYTTCENRLNG